MADIDRIIRLIDNYLEMNGADSASANEISSYLEAQGALSYSTKGQPLRKLLREGKIPNAFQPGGKGTTWIIRHSAGIRATARQCTTSKADARGNDRSKERNKKI